MLNILDLKVKIWEHTKLLWIPLLTAFAVLAWRFPGMGRGRWLTAAVPAQSVAIITMLAGHYLFTGALGAESMAGDIVLYFAALLAAMLAARHALRHRLQGPGALCWALLGAEAAMFALLTYFPPKWPLFVPA